MSDEEILKAYPSDLKDFTSNKRFFSLTSYYETPLASIFQTLVDRNSNETSFLHHAQAMFKAVKFNKYFNLTNSTHTLPNGIKDGNSQFSIVSNARFYGPIVQNPEKYILKQPVQFLAEKNSDTLECPRLAHQTKKQSQISFLGNKYCSRVYRLYHDILVFFTLV